MKKQPKKYRILPVGHLLRNNQMAKAGDVVEGSKFIDLEDALKNGFCEPVDTIIEVDAKVIEEGEKEAENIEGLEDIEVDFDDLSGEKTQPLEEMTMDQLKDLALNRDIELTRDEKRTKKALLKALKDKL